MSNPGPAFTAEYLAQIRREESVEIRRRFRQIPPKPYLPQSITDLDQEIRRLQIRRRNIHTEWSRLSSEDGVKEAFDLDQAAAVAAMRAGKPASSAGAKAEAARRKQLADLDSEGMAIAPLIGALEVEMEAEFAKLAADDKTSGRTAVTAAKAKLEKALDALEDARADYHGAAIFTAYIEAAAIGAEVQWTGPVVPSLDLSDHGARLGIRMYSSDPTPTLELSDVVALIRTEMATR